MNKQDKDPMAWEVIDSEYLFKRPWLTARRDHVKLPTGAEIHDFYVLEYPEFLQCNSYYKRRQVPDGTPVPPRPTLYRNRNSRRMR